jgi:hypothetical protein
VAINKYIKPTIEIELLLNETRVFVMNAFFQRNHGVVKKKISKPKHRRVRHQISTRTIANLYLRFKRFKMFKKLKFPKNYISLAYPAFN